MKFNQFLTPVQALVVIAVLNTACGKYPEGPGFSLRSKVGRLSGEWEWVDDKEGIEIDLDDLSYDFEFEILRLTNREMILEDENGDEFELEKL